MANKKEKEKQLQDKLQIILADLLKDDDNKYCVDCDSKGPRWASWTLGIFLCIRCAGIHRNLGVHLSRVKSVNLDSWTPQQVAMMKEIGNSRGRAIYEANLDDNFRRPQTDSALEQFVRAKYEHKRYIAKEWIAPTPTVDIIAEEIRKLEQNQNKKRLNYNANTTSGGGGSGANIPISRRDNADKAVKETEKPTNTCNKVDLLGLDCDPVPNNAADDTFGDFIFAAQPFDKSAPNQTSLNGLDVNTVPVSSAVDDLMGLNLGNGEIISNIPGINMPPPSLSMSTPSFTNSAGKLDKSSILALYNNSNSAGGNAMGTQMTNVPGGWSHAGGGPSAYQQSSSAMQSDFHSQMLYGGGSNWQISGQGSNVASAAFGVQHNPFFNNSIFPGQSAIPISQPTSFPAASVPGGGHAQPPNQMLW